MRDAFAVLFFVSVGMLFDPGFLLQAPLLVAATAANVILGKPLAALGIVLVLGYPTRVAMAVAVALAQIGEFSFILAKLGEGLRVLPVKEVIGADGALRVEAGDTMHALVAAAIVSISLNPLLYRLVDPLEGWISRRPRLRRWLSGRPGQPAADASGRPDRPADQHRAVVVGYGPVGRTVSRLLGENEIVPTVVEMNLETVRRLREQGASAVYGDASHRDTLKAAGVEGADNLILSASGLRNAEEIIRLARELNPDVRVLVRCAYLRERPALRLAGADEVFAGEGEVALTMTESILRDLGATSEQIDRERARVRGELFDSPAAREDGPPSMPGLAEPGQGRQ